MFGDKMNKMKYYRVRAGCLICGAVLFLVVGYFNLRTGRQAEGMATLVASVIFMTMFSALVVCKQIEDATLSSHMDNQSEHTKDVE